NIVAIDMYFTGLFNNILLYSLPGHLEIRSLHIGLPSFLYPLYWLRAQLTLLLEIQANMT
ncbi:hypothetical protein ACJX0J_038552, partial [Zea mays]